MNQEKPNNSSRVKTEIEYKLFEITLWLTVFVFLIWWIVAFIADYNLIIKITYTFCLLLYSSLFIAFKKNVSFNILASIYYLSALIVVTLTWLPSGGITGTILLMVVMIYVSGLLVLPGRIFLVYIGITMIILTYYVIYQLNFPDAAVSYTDKLSRIRDFSIAGLISLSAIGYALFIFKKAYTEDRIELKETIKELEKEKEKALSADKAKSDFLATISHEMRTPLNGIVGLSELLKETSLDEEQGKLLSNLSYSSEHLHGLISDILDVTLIESGKLVLQTNDIDIKSEIEKLVSIVKPRVDKKEGLSIQIEHDKNVPHLVIGDQLRFRQVLLNLINNAIKFTDAGEIKITSELLKASDQGINIRVKVSDTGMGISSEGQKQLFSKFFKANVNSNIEGTGLGLSISKNLVSLMGGDIGFESEEKVGSTFHFEIPFKEYIPIVNKEIDTALKEKPLNDINLLIAEDVHINQVVIKKLVESLGLTSIDLAGNGEIAVKKVKENRYDVILMDIQMPVMGGLEASRLITDYFKGKNKPIIIAVTANAFVSDLDNYEEAGINGYLSKPITKAALREALSNFI